MTVERGQARVRQGRSTHMLPDRPMFALSHPKLAETLRKSGRLRMRPCAADMHAQLGRDTLPTPLWGSQDASEKSPTGLHE